MTKPSSPTRETEEEVRLELYREQRRNARGSSSAGTIMVPCFFCGTQFQMGTHVYRGKHIGRYMIDVCDGCYAGNWDGWAPDFEERLIPHLKAKGLPVPERNEKQWLPRD